MEKKRNRKTLAVKVSEEFYNEVVKYAHENYMNVSSLLRKALLDAFELEENNTAAAHKDEEQAAARTQQIRRIRDDNFTNTTLDYGSFKCSNLVICILEYWGSY